MVLRLGRRLRRPANVELKQRSNRRCQFGCRLEMVRLIETGGISLPERALILTGTENGTAALIELLGQAGYAPVETASREAEARKRLSEDTFSAVVICVPPDGESGVGLAGDIVRTTDIGVLLILRGEMPGRITAALEEEGVLILQRPVSRPLFLKAVRLVGAMRRRIRSLRLENAKLQSKIEEIRLVDRAKCVLMQVLILTEPQAHRYIEKQAMDLRCTKKQVAEDILKTYEM